MNYIFTGVGSRYGAPVSACNKAIMITKWLCERKFTVRTGDAIGMDEVFRTAAGANARYYAPLTRTRPIPGSIIIGPSDTLPDYYAEAVNLTANTHPYFNTLKGLHRELHVRNAFQVLGDDLQQPADFLLCWTPDGAETHTSRKTGGTGQAIRIAIMYNIPVFNINAPNFEQRFSAFINTLARQQQ